MVLQDLAGSEKQETKRTEPTNLFKFDHQSIMGKQTLRVRETSSLMPTRPKVKVKPHPGKYVVCGVQNCLTTVCLSGFDAHCKAMHASLSVEELNFCEIPAYPRQWRSIVTNDPAPPPRRSGRKLRRSVTAPKPIRPASNLIHFFESFVPEEVKNRSEGPDFKLKF